MPRDVALVTGASGFVGRWVVRALCRRGLHVRAGVHRAGDLAHFRGHDGVEVIRLDILDRDSVRRALRGVDRVFHVAALTDPRAPAPDLFRVNVEGTRLVWECAAGEAAAALYCSSASVYGLLAGPVRPISEETTPRAVEPYGRSKLMGEMAAIEVSRRTGLSTVIIRPVAIFGYRPATPFAIALRTAAVSRVLLTEGFRGKQFSFVHVEDVAEAAVHLLDCAAGQLYNVAAPKAVSFDDAFQAYRRALPALGTAVAAGPAAGAHLSGDLRHPRLGGAWFSALAPGLRHDLLG